LLDFIDRSDLRNLGASSDAAVRVFEQQKLMRTVVPLFVCPSRPCEPLSPVSPHPSFRLLNSEYPDEVAKNDYAINAGDSTYSHCFSFRYPTSLVRADEFAWTLNLAECTGVGFQRSEIRYRDILDGASTTVLVGEKAVPASAYNNATNRGYDHSMFVGQCMDLQRRTSETPLHDQSVAQTVLGDHSSSRFGSAHRSGCPVVFCDGHVKIVSYYVDRQIFRRLGNRMDGEVVGSGLRMSVVVVTRFAGATSDVVASTLDLT
jgi:prepilin-type processing-associated H-X9-DG protein